jgi:hypothetical protein
MRRIDRKTIYLLFLLLYFATTTALTQQFSAAAPDTKKGAGKNIPLTVPGKDESAQTSKQDDEYLKEKLLNGNLDKPSLPGVQTQVIPEGKKIPERVDPVYEDWSKPALTPGMHADIAPMAKSVHDGFTRELVHVQWRELDPIDLWIVKPTGVKNPPVVLYLYSYPSTNDRYKNLQFCQFLAKKGFAAVGFVAALTDQRFHDRPTKDWFVSQLQESLGASVHDVQMILNYLSNRHDLDMTRVGMWGDGSGASIAIMAAAVDPRIKALDLLDPWGDWPDWLAKSSLVPEKERAEYLKPEFLKSVADLDPLQWLPQLKADNVRLQYINQGIAVTPALVMNHMEAAAPSNVKIIHYANTKAFVDQVASRGTGFDWIKEQLGSAANRPRHGDQSMTEVSQGVRNSDRSAH